MQCQREFEGSRGNGATPSAPQLAAAIAAESDGNEGQYAGYSKKLATPLVNLTPAQRAKVFGN